MSSFIRKKGKGKDEKEEENKRYDVKEGLEEKEDRYDGKWEVRRKGRARAWEEEEGLTSAVCQGSSSS